MKKVLVGILLLVVVLSVFLILRFQPFSNRDLAACDARTNPPGRFMDFSLLLTDRDGSPLQDKKVTIRQIEQDFVLLIMEDSELSREFQQSLSFECEVYTKSGFSERAQYSKTQLDEMCHFEDMGITSRDNPRSVARISPSRLRDKSFSEQGENQDRIEDEALPKVTFEEYSKIDLDSTEMYLDLMKEYDVSPYMIQVCGEWNAWDLKSLKGLNPQNLALHCDQLIRLTRERYPDTLIAVDLLPFYYYPERGLCKPHCSYLDENFFNGDHYITDETFLDALEQLDSPYDVISVEYQMGHEHAGDAEDLIFLTERFKKYDKKIFNWDLTFLSQHSFYDCSPGVECNRWPEEDRDFTEEWQAEQYQRYFDYVLNDPDNIGVTMFFLQDPRPEPRPGMVAYAYPGFLREDGAEKPSLNTLFEFWNAMQTNCYAQTDQDGILTFQGNPGIYEIWINGTFKKEQIHLTGSETISIEF
jgi:hypothetical protein